MRSAHLISTLLLTLACVTTPAAVDFDRDIRPLLSDRCFKCHGPDEKQREAKLRLDTQAGIASVVQPGNVSASDLFRRIVAHDPDDRMPPPDSRLSLATHEKRLLANWIKAGAKFSRHWAFVPPRASKPTGKRNPIDEFIDAQNEHRGLTNAPPASREVLIRRLSFDLTGLPPTPAEIDAFLRDDQPNADGRLIVRLLASKRFGERMASYWLDAARYADTSGYLYDWPRTQWPWRDWVIRAFNDNLPFNDFIRWQIAGDLMPNPIGDQIIATAFNRNHGYTIENGIIGEEYRTAYVADRVTTLGTVFLGLTLECARCHDHKYDPITQKDFYELFAFFNHAPEVGVQPNKATFATPFVGVPQPPQLQAIEDTENRIKKLNNELIRPDTGADAGQPSWESQVQSQWTLLRPRNAKSRRGATFKIKPDHSIQVTGPNPESDQYVVHLHQQTKGFSTAIRLEALSDPTMKNGGPGRSANGNALLTFVTVTKIREDGFREAIPLIRASADRASPPFLPEGAIDSGPRTGWAAPSNGGRSPCSIVLEFSKPHEFKTGDIVEAQLTFGSPYPQHTFGRIRFALTTRAAPTRLDPTGLVDHLASLPVSQRSEQEAEIVRRFTRSRFSPTYRKLNAQILDLEKQLAGQRDAIPNLMIMQDTMRRKTHVLARGRYDEPGEEVQPDTPGILPPFPEGAPRNRLGLAQWLTSQENPLVARVIVNQIWQLFFGRGLVKSVDDFGVQGERPSHPELLDFLASDFVQRGWNVKRLIHLIVSSEAYQRDSNTTPEQLRSDPDNHNLTRGPRFRLPAEMIRDSALFVSSLLHEQLGGPSVKPYQPAGLWARLTKHPDFQQTYQPDTGQNLYRRSLYTYWKRASLHPMLATFDAPRRQVCTVSRRPTNTPQQALILLHDPQFVEAARHLADR
ncbi:MAG: PSD1 and planctomycete cytochrome C domain-containing protein, partial [Limisphaerales bacterium]